MSSQEEKNNKPTIITFPVNRTMTLGKELIILEKPGYEVILNNEDLIIIEIKRFRDS